MVTLAQLGAAIERHRVHTGKRPILILCHPDVWAAWSSEVTDQLIAEPLTLLSMVPPRRAIWGIPVRLDPNQPLDGYTLSYSGLVWYDP